MLGKIYNNLIYLFLKISNKNINEIRIYLEDINKKLVDLYQKKEEKENKNAKDKEDNEKEKAEKTYYKKLVIINHFMDYILIYSDTKYRKYTIYYRK